MLPLEKVLKFEHRYGEAEVPLPLQVLQVPVAPPDIVRSQKNGELAKLGFAQVTVVADALPPLLAMDTDL